MAEIVNEVILKVNTQEPVKNLKDLRDNVKAYKDELVPLDKNTKEYNQTLDKLIQSQSKLTEITLSVNSANQNFIQTLSQLTRAAGGVTAGFGAVSSAAALLGADNEDLVKTLVRLQAGLALTQQLSSLATGLRSANLAFRALNVTISQSQLFIIAGVITAIAAAVQYFSNEVDEAKEKSDSLNKSITDLQDAFDKSSLYYRQISSNIQEGLLTIEENYRIEYNLLVQQNANKDAFLKLDEKRAKERNDLIKSENKSLLDQYNTAKNLQTLQIDLGYDLIKSDRFTNNRIKEQQQETNLEILNNIRTVNSAILQSEKELYNARKAIIDNQRTEQQKIATQRKSDLKIIEEAEKQARQRGLNDYEKQLDSALALYNKNKEVYIRQGKDITELYQDYQQQISDIQQRYSISRQQQAIQYNQNTYNEIINESRINISNLENELSNFKFIPELDKSEFKTLDEYYDYLDYRLQEETRLTNEIIAERQRIFDYEDELRQKQIAALESQLELEVLTTEERQSLESQLIDFRFELSQARIDNEQATNEALNALYQQDYNNQKSRLDDEKKLRESSLKNTATLLTETSKLFGDHTAANKSLAVAGATIDTYRAGASALADTPGGPIIKGLALAATIATGLATVKNILSTDVPGATKNTASPSTPTVTIPSFPTLDTGFIETHNNIDSYDEYILNQQPVLVVEDLNSVQNRVRITESESTF